MNTLRPADEAIPEGIRNALLVKGVGAFFAETDAELTYLQGYLSALECIADVSAEFIGRGLICVKLASESPQAKQTKEYQDAMAALVLAQQTLTRVTSEWLKIRAVREGADLPHIDPASMMQGTATAQ